jgi:predicted site-specific integrase-resolvase
MIKGTSYYTKKRLAQELGVCIRTIDKWAAKGMIGYSKIDRRVIFSQTDIDDFLERYHRPSVNQLDDLMYDHVRARYKSKNH